MKVPASHQNVTQNKRRKVNVPSAPAILLNTWIDSPPPGVAFGIGTSISYQSVLVPHSLQLTDSNCAIFDVADLLNHQVPGDVVTVPTTPHAPLTSARLRTHPPCHGWASSSHQCFTTHCGLPTLPCLDYSNTAPVETP